MSFPATAPGKTETANTTGFGGGPAAHEDLTIAEQLELMRTSDEHRPGEQCFILSNGEKRSVADHEIQRFLITHGAEHSSDYLTANGANWEDAFFHMMPGKNS